jgi:DNA processing protein
VSLEGDALLTLALTPGIGPRTAARLLSRFGTAAAALAASEGEWRAEAGVPVALRRAVGTARPIDQLREECARQEISIVPLNSAQYPEALSAIYDPPPVLYIRGRSPPADAFERSVAVVGTRKPSSQGLAFANRLAGDLSRAGAVIVSGLAMGIDAEAHRAVVRSGGTGIAVLPGGLDRVHPPANRQLAAELCKRGCLISEHPPGSAIRRGNFVGRNRLISGLARAVAVVEAGERSGALLTADFACEQGRAVLAMPGRPGDERVAGNLRLLQEGAGLLLSADDVVAELRLPAGEPSRIGLPELGPAAGILAGGASFDAILAVSRLEPTEPGQERGRLELEGRVQRAVDGRYYLLDG